MPKNIEIKAHVENYQAIVKTAEKLAGHLPSVIDQKDTFFNCPDGRLKLRTFSDGSGQLIFYQRASEKGPKASFYKISPTTSPATLKQVLSLAYGVLGRVNKQRLLFIVKRTRIHIDKVENLGEFIELEVVLDDNSSQSEAIKEAQDLMAKLGITPSMLIQDAYVDMMPLGNKV